MDLVVQPSPVRKSAGAPFPTGWRASAGFSLIELLVATLLIMIVFVAWMRVSNFQAIRKESFRRAAIEKAAGYLDVMAPSGKASGFYKIVYSGGNYLVQTNPASGYLLPIFGEADYPSSCPVGYVLWVESRPATNGWPSGRWAVVSLYDKYGMTTNEITYGGASSLVRPFSSLSVFMATNYP